MIMAFVSATRCKRNSLNLAYPSGPARERVIEGLDRLRVSSRLLPRSSLVAFTLVHVQPTCPLMYWSKLSRAAQRVWALSVFGDNPVRPEGRERFPSDNMDSLPTMNIRPPSPHSQFSETAQ